MNKFVLSILLVATMGIFAGCTKYKDQKKAVSGFAKVYCYESFKNILEQEIAIFEYQYPQSNVVDIEWDGSQLSKARIISRRGGTLRLRSFVPLHGEGLKAASGTCPNELLAPAAIKQPKVSDETII